MRDTGGKHGSPRADTEDMCAKGVSVCVCVLVVAALRVTNCYST